MSLIKNLIKETENKPRKKKKNAGSDESDAGDKDKPLGPFIKSATDLQRLKLEKLMKNPEKPVIIPEQRRERDYMSSVPTFVRNVMGSSAGAGSGEFHVYRHLRRKEYARQKNIQNQSLREAADDAYQQKLDDNKRTADERTAKKRAKRLKKKQRAKKPRQQKPNEDQKPASESSESASEDEDTTADVMPLTESKETNSDKAPSTEVPDKPPSTEAPDKAPSTEAANNASPAEAAIKASKDEADKASSDEDANKTSSADQAPSAEAASKAHSADQVPSVEAADRASSADANEQSRSAEAPDQPEKAQPATVTAAEQQEN